MSAVADVAVANVVLASPVEACVRGTAAANDFQLDGTASQTYIVLF